MNNTLYDRLSSEEMSGAYKIASIVDDFINRLGDNDVVCQNPLVKELSGEKMAGHKFETTMLICQHAGGPYTYTGRSLEEAHRHLNISEEEWDAGMIELKNALDANNVSKDEKEEIIKYVESTKNDIVVIDPTDPSDDPNVGFDF